MKDTITREEAWALIQEFGGTENHVRHMPAVEAAMRAYARRFGEDEDTWGAIGLVHDFEYDQFPDEHPHAGGRILREKGYSDKVVNAVLSHGETGIPRDTPMTKALHAVDELTGLLVAGDPDTPVVRFGTATIVRLVRERGSWSVDWMVTPESARQAV